MWYAENLGGHIVRLDNHEEMCMRPLRRSGVNKQRSAKTFRRHSHKTAAINMAAPMRGGIRL